LKPTFCQACTADQKGEVEFLDVNTFAAGLIQAVHAKTGGSHAALHGNFSQDLGQVT